jgi:peptide/nickel transport system permease protein
MADNPTLDRLADLPGPRVSPWRIIAKNRASLIGLFVFGLLLLVAVFGGLFSPYLPEKVGVGPPMNPPGSRFLMGTDELGRDIFSRVLDGVRLSFFIGIVSALVSTLVGVCFGAISGFFGRWVDDVLMRITEVFQTIPRFFLVMMLIAFFGSNLSNIILAIALLSWPQLARLVRAEFLSLKSRQFVDAARTAGASTPALIFFEILPNALGPLIVNSTLLVGQAMLQEAGLSFIGLGDPTHVSLGIMLFQAQGIMRTAWWATAFPGLFIFLAVLSINLIGDGLNDLLSPRSRER